MSIQTVLDWNQTGVEALVENDRKKASSSFLNALHILRKLSRSSKRDANFQCSSSSSFPLHLRWTADLGHATSDEPIELSSSSSSSSSSSFVIQRAAHIHLLPSITPTAGDRHHQQHHYSDREQTITHGTTGQQSYNNTNNNNNNRQVIDGATVVVLYNLAVTFHLDSFVVQDNEPSQNQELALKRSIAMYSIVWDMRMASSKSSSSKRAIAAAKNNTKQRNNTNNKTLHPSHQHQCDTFDQMLRLLDMATANNLGNLYQQSWEHDRARRFFRQAGCLLSRLRRTTTAASPSWLLLLSKEEQNGVFCNSLLLSSHCSPAA